MSVKVLAKVTIHNSGEEDEHFDNFVLQIFASYFDNESEDLIRRAPKVEDMVEECYGKLDELKPPNWRKNTHFYKPATVKYYNKSFGETVRAEMDRIIKNGEKFTVDLFVETNAKYVTETKTWTKGIWTNKQSTFSGPTNNPSCSSHSSENGHDSKDGGNSHSQSSSYLRSTLAMQNEYEDCGRKSCVLNEFELKLLREEVVLLKKCQAHEVEREFELKRLRAEIDALKNVRTQLAEKETEFKVLRAEMDVMRKAHAELDRARMALITSKSGLVKSNMEQIWLKDAELERLKKQIGKSGKQSPAPANHSDSRSDFNEAQLNNSSKSQTNHSDSKTELGQFQQSSHSGIRTNLNKCQKSNKKTKSKHSKSTTALNELCQLNTNSQTQANHSSSSITEPNSSESKPRLNTIRTNLKKAQMSNSNNRLNSKTKNVEPPIYHVL